MISYPYIIGKMNLAPYTSLRFVDAETGETIPITDIIFQINLVVRIVGYKDGVSESEMDNIIAE